MNSSVHELTCGICLGAEIGNCAGCRNDSETRRKNRMRDRNREAYLDIENADNFDVQEGSDEYTRKLSLSGC